MYLQETESMFNRCNGLIVAAALLVLFTSVPGRSQARGGPPPARAASASNIPRMPDGKPNFTGLWQSLGSAYWDIRDHSAQPGPFFQLGAIGAMPAGQGIVDGGDIPYKPEAAAKQQENYRN